jgi:tetratricopeptide (TPR) repeat protein
MQLVSVMRRKSTQIPSALQMTVLMAFLALTLSAQETSVRVRGKVIDAAGHPVADALVTLHEPASKSSVRATTDAAGAFVLPVVPLQDAEITASREGWTAVTQRSASTLDDPIELVLHPASSSTIAGEMQFSDDPHFTVAGVTDWTAVGGHGSDSTLRTSEAMASTSAALPTRTNRADTSTEQEMQLEREFRDDSSQGHVERAQTKIHTVLQAHPTATLYRLAGEVDEQRNESLAAVHEFEQAAKLDPSETNEFEWGSELLRHRAVWQAKAVFERGVALYPNSVRMQTALGTALFAGARYEEAAERLCKASDLAPTEQAPYTFMGEAELASPNALGCIEPRMERYVRLRPDSADAWYLYAMALLKQQGSAPDAKTVALAESLLIEAVQLNPKFADVYLELGILATQRNDLPAAIRYYDQAVNADPTMVDAYYRLANTYERTHETDKAKAAFARHDELARMQANAAEQQRKAIKQFIFDNPSNLPAVTTP